MAKKDFIARPYNSFLLPNDRKLAYLEETWNAYKSIKTVLHRFLIAAYGSIPFHAFAKTIENTTEDELQLAYAVRMFRLVPKDFSKNESNISPDILICKLASYTNINETPANVLSYVNSNYDPEKYKWIDSRNEAISLSKEIGIKLDELADYATTMLWEDWLPLNKDTVNGWGTTSGLFGAGKKEDRTQKVQMLNALLLGLKNNPPKDYKQYSTILLKAFDAKSWEEAVKIYKGECSGRTSSYLTEKHGDISPETLGKIITSIERDVADKQHSINLPKREEIKAYLEKQSDTPYNLNLWSQALHNAMSSIKKTDTRNFNSTLEKYEKEIQLKECLQDGDDVELLGNKFFLSPYHKTNDVFVICSEHIGTNRKYNVVEQMYQLASEHADFEAAFTLLKDEYEEKGIKTPIKNILEYIWNNKNVPVNTWGRIAKYNQLKDRLAGIKANPTVECNRGMTFGNSAMVGEVVRSNRISTSTKNKGQILAQMHNDRPVGSNNMIWLEMTLLNNGKWEKHHIPTHNNKFFEEVHAFNPELKQSVNVRNRMYRSQNYSQLPTSLTDGLQGNPKAKIFKRQYRALNNMTANVIDPKLSFIVNKKDGRFEISIIHNVEVIRARRDVLVGDYLVGMDQNQTASNTYAVMQVVKPNTPDSHEFRNQWVKFIESGKIESSTLNSRGEYIDQLSHDGVDLQEIKDSEWIPAAEKFLNKLGAINKDGTPISISNTSKRAYTFNSIYFKILLNYLRANDVDLNLVREEILRIANGRFSPMRLGSLSWTTLKMLGNFRNLIHSYFDHCGFKEMPERESKDKTMYDLLMQTITKLTNKRAERTSRIAGSLMNVAHKYKIGTSVVHVVVEGSLSKTDKSSSKGNNRNTTDWCSRAVVKKLEDMCVFYGFNLKAVSAHYTSHQDPLVHRADYDDPKLALRCRYSSYSRADFEKWGEKSFAAVIRWATDKKSNTCYKVGAVEFFKNYKIPEDKITKKLTIKEFVEIMCAESHYPNEYDDILIPRRGGRIYLTTKKLLSDSTHQRESVHSHTAVVKMNGKEYYSSDADEVAAINICLHDWVVPCKRKPKDE